MNYQGKNKIIFTGTGIFFIACMLLTLNLSLDEKITSMLPNSDPMVKDFNYIINNIPATETLYIDIENLHADNKIFEQIADSFFDDIHTSPYFSGIVYKFSHDSFLNLLKLVSANRLSLLNKTDLAAIESRLNPEQIHEQLIEIKRKLLSPSGIFMAAALIDDPLKIDELILSKLNAFEKETFGSQIKGSRIYNNNGTHLLMMATPNFSAMDTAKSVQMMGFLNDIRDKITKKYKNNIHIRFSGSHAATLDNSQTIQQDVKLAVSVLTIGIFIIGILFFRRMVHVILIFLPTLVSLAFASAVISLTNNEVSAIALGCGTILLGITVDFGIHILFNIDNSQEVAPDAVITRLRLPIWAGACTTMVAFSCLLFSSLPGQRQMGIFAILGIFGAAFFALFLLKFFIPPLKTKQKKPIISLVKICDRLMDFRRNHIRIIIFAGMTLIIMGMIGIRDFRFEGDISKLNHLQPITKSDMDNFLETWGGFSQALVLVKAGSIEAALQKNDALFDLLKRMQKKGMIDQIASLSDILPSNEKRNSNYINFKTFMTENRIKNIEQMFRNASILTGFKENTFNSFFDSLKQDRTFFSIKDFGNTALEKLIASKVVSKGNDVLILTTLNIKDKSLTPEIIKKIKSEIDGSMFLDKKYFIEQMTSHVSGEFKRLVFFTAASMILVLSLFFRNLKIVLIIVCPVFLSAFITAGILGLTDIPINLISMIFIIFVFGVGVDFSIFLMNHELWKTDNKNNVTAAAVIICAMTTTAAFDCLALAKHAALFSIGVAGLTGMITSLILALMLIPSLAQRFVNENDKEPFNG
ncbi:MAG: MMPL family transporter [Proteobacteria bacterium]|nr:MMPL family transporter [Pseudomonadota bacterium]